VNALAQQHQKEVYQMTSAAKPYDAKAINEIMAGKRSNDEIIESEMRHLINSTFKGDRLAAALDWLERKAIGPR
jgi:hypothetical protein